MARSVISPIVSSFWLWTLSPFSFGENISSFDTGENLASAGAVPVVLASSAKTGLASKASDAASSAIFFIVSSSIAELQFYNARSEQTFRDLIGEQNAQDATRRASSVSRASSDFAESDGSMVASVTTGSERVSRLPWLV